MSEEVVHIKDGSDRYSLCRKDLFRCVVDPYLFVDGYNPRRSIYSIYRTINIGKLYPIIEQVEVCDDLNFCESCLSDFGMRLLNVLANIVNGDRIKFI
jgi:hypothetical protein